MSLHYTIGSTESHSSAIGTLLNKGIYQKILMAESEIAVGHFLTNFRISLRQKLFFGTNLLYISSGEVINILVNGRPISNPYFKHCNGISTITIVDS